MKTVNVVEGKSPLTRSVEGKPRLRNELIAFWMRNPEGRFTASVIACALDCKRGEAKAILDELYGEGLIEKYVHEGLTLYTLTDDESKRESLFQYFSSSGSK